jgi:hypothetical protein
MIGKNNINVGVFLIVRGKMRGLKWLEEGLKQSSMFAGEFWMHV